MVKIKLMKIINYNALKETNNFYFRRKKKNKQREINGKTLRS